MTISYQLKDELKLTPSASQFSMTVAFLPWNIKPLYGWVYRFELHSYWWTDKPLYGWVYRFELYSYWWTDEILFLSILFFVVFCSLLLGFCQTAYRSMEADGFLILFYRAFFLLYLGFYLGFLKLWECQQYAWLGFWRYKILGQPWRML